MTLTKPMLPDIVLTLLAGHWPEGDEDAMRRVADEWDAMAKALDELSEPADNAMKTTLASIDGKIHNAMTTFWQEIGGDAGALKGMIDACNSMQEGLEKGATDIEHAKWTIYGGLAASIAMFFIPGPTQALAAASARIFLRGVIAKLIARLAATGSVTLAKRLMVIAESRALEFAVGGATIGAIQGAGIDLAAQGIEYGLGHRDGIDLGSAALGAVTGAAGGAVGGVVTGGVTPIVQHGLAHATGQDAANIASSKLGSYTVDVVSETVAAVPGNVAGAAAAYPFTGQYDDSSIHEGMAGGVISRGGREPHPKGGGDHSDVAPEIDPNTVLTTAAVQVPAPDHAQPPAQLVATGEIAADQPRTNAAGTVDSVTQAGAQPVLEKAAQGAISDADAHQTPGGTVTDPTGAQQGQPSHQPPLSRPEQAMPVEITGKPTGIGPTLGATDPARRPDLQLGRPDQLIARSDIPPRSYTSTRTDTSTPAGPEAAMRTEATTRADTPIRAESAAPARAESPPRPDSVSRPDASEPVRPEAQTDTRRLPVVNPTPERMPEPAPPGWRMNRHSIRGGPHDGRPNSEPPTGPFDEAPSQKPEPFDNIVDPRRTNPTAIDPDTGITTDAGVSYHARDSEIGLHAQRVKPDPDGRWTLDVRIGEGRATVGDRSLTADEFAHVVRSHPGYSDAPIRLFGCDSESNQFAKALARALDVPVLAATKPVWTSRHGTAFSTDVVFDGHGRFRPRIPPDGAWAIHYPDGSEHSVGRDAYPPSASWKLVGSGPTLLDFDEALHRGDDWRESPKDALVWDEQYADYVARAIRRGREPNNKDVWRRNVQLNYYRGLAGNKYHAEAAEKMGLTDASGWQQEHSVELDRPELGAVGERIIDAAHPEMKKAVEYKLSVRHPKAVEKALVQQEKDRALMRDGWSVDWVIKDVLKVDPRIIEGLRLLRFEFPNKFRALEFTLDREPRDLGGFFETLKAVDLAKGIQPVEFRAMSAHKEAVRELLLGVELGSREAASKVMEARNMLIEHGQFLATDERMREGAATIRESGSREMVDKVIEILRLDQGLEDQLRDHIMERFIPFDSPERRAALERELTEIGVELELIDVRMLVEQTQGRSHIDMARDWNRLLIGRELWNTIERLPDQVRETLMYQLPLERSLEFAEQLERKHQARQQRRRTPLELSREHGLSREPD